MLMILSLPIQIYYSLHDYIKYFGLLKHHMMWNCFKMISIIFMTDDDVSNKLCLNISKCKILQYLKNKNVNYIKHLHKYAKLSVFNVRVY